MLYFSLQYLDCNVQSYHVEVQTYTCQLSCIYYTKHFTFSICVVLIAHIPILNIVLQFNYFLRNQRRRRRPTGLCDPQNCGVLYVFKLVQTTQKKKQPFCHFSFLYYTINILRSTQYTVILYDVHQLLSMYYEMMIKYSYEFKFFCMTEELTSPLP